MDILIRKAKEEDFDSILSLANQLYEAEQPFDKNIKDGYYNTEEGRKELLKNIKSRKRMFFVATLENAIVGFVDGFIINKEDVYIEKLAYLDRISVDCKYKNKGIGSKLIDKFTGTVKDKGAKYIKLNVFRNNIPAISLYEKNNFKEYSVFYMKKI